MSASREVEYTCPYCGKTYTITVYDSINTAQDPDLRERCISGDIFHHVCPQCRKSYMVTSPLLYMDPSYKFVIYVDENDNSALLSSVAKPLVQQGYTLRRCPTVTEFVEKIQVFEDEVDDRAVELAKYDSFIEFIDNKKGKPEEITSIEYQHTENEVMKINIRMDDKGMTFYIPVQMMEEEIKVESDRFEVDNTKFPVVNFDWIIDIYTEAEGTA